MTNYVAPLPGPITITSVSGPRLITNRDGQLVPNFHPGVDIVGSQNISGPVSSMEGGTIVGEFRYGDGTLNVLVAGNDGRTILYSGLSNNTYLPV
jgi:murein DD-endopeptidase MepM/ murein hydrolase activator NlpD